MADRRAVTAAAGELERVDLAVDTLPASRAARIFTQVAHGFAVGTVVYRTTGGAWALASQASRAVSGDGVVSAVLTADIFEVTFAGYIEGLSGLTAGTTYYTSATAGAFTATEPTRVISGSGGSAPPAPFAWRPILRAITATTAVVLDRSPLSGDAQHFGADRCTNLGPALTATSGTTFLTHIRCPSTGTMPTRSGSFYYVEWFVNWTTTATTEPIGIRIVLNGTTILNGAGTFHFRKAPQRAFAPSPERLESYSGFGFFTGSGADVVTLEFNAPEALGGTVALFNGFVNFYRVNAG